MGTLNHVDCVDYGYSGLWRLCGLWIQWIMYTVDCRDFVDYVLWTMWIMDTMDYSLQGLCIQWIAGIMWIMGTLDHVDYGYSGLQGLCGLWVLWTMWIMDRVDYVYSGFLSDKVKSIHNDNVIWMSDMVMDIKWIHGWMAKLCMFLYFHALLSHHRMLQLSSLVNIY